MIQFILTIFDCNNRKRTNIPFSKVRKWQHTLQLTPESITGNSTTPSSKDNKDQMTHKNITFSQLKRVYKQDVVTFTCKFKKRSNIITPDNITN